MAWDIKSCTEDVVGYIYSEDGVYDPREISFTVLEGKRIEIGNIVCIEHPSREGLPVFYQVIDVPLRRKAKDYEEDLVRIGTPLMDETRNYPRARAVQIGYYVEGEEEPRMLIEHIKPLSKVYRPSQEVLEELLYPKESSIVVGEIYPSFQLRVELELPKLLRQGLLVVGGVGTGKTTTMLTVLVRVIRKIVEEGGIPRVLIVDKDGEYGAEELINCVGRDMYVRIPIDAVYVDVFKDKDKFAQQLLRKFGYHDRRTKVAKTIYAIVQEFEDRELELSKDFIEQNILPRIIDEDVRAKVASALEKWREETREGMPLSNLMKLIHEKCIVHLDLSTCRDFDHAFMILDEVLSRIYDTALSNERFGCIIVIDEAHLFCPERGGIELSPHVKQLKKTIELIATTGPRNGVTPFMATQRPSLISKTITTQLGQNIIAHRVEDIDLERIKEIMGAVARRTTILPRGWAIVKSQATKIRQPVIARITAVAKPTSTGKTAYERFKMKK